VRIASLEYQHSFLDLLHFYLEIVVSESRFLAARESNDAAFTVPEVTCLAAKQSADSDSGKQR
jgi:hypothetical protein